MKIVGRVALMIAAVFDSVSWDCRKVVAASIRAVLYRVCDHTDAVVVQLDAHVFEGGVPTEAGGVCPAVSVVPGLCICEATAEGTVRVGAFVDGGVGEECARGAF